MSPLEALLAESIPHRPAPPPRRPWTPEEQDAHWNALAHAVGRTGEKRPPHPNAPHDAA